MYDLGPALENATVEPGTNLLVAGPPLTGKRRLAMDVLAAGATAGEGSVIVTTRDAADRVLADFRSLLGDPEYDDVGVIDSVTQHQGQSVQDSGTVKYASSPMDMTGIGIAFSEFLEAFAVDRGLTANRVMLDSLTPLLIYADRQTVFRFMHVFTSRIENADALGLHVIDSTAHDAETINTLKQLFDGVVGTNEDSELSLQLPEPDAGVAGP